MRVRVQVQPHVKPTPRPAGDGPALRRRGDPPFEDGTVITTTDGRAMYVVQGGKYQRVEGS